MYVQFCNINMTRVMKKKNLVTPRKLPLNSVLKSCVALGLYVFSHRHGNIGEN